MSRTLIQLPYDVVLEILKLCDLEDIMSLLQTSKAFYSISCEPTLWKEVLAAYRTKRPLPCPDGQSLKRLKGDILKDMAFRTYRLNKNLGRLHPGVMGNITSIFVGHCARVVALVPGTPLVFTFSPITKCLSCWNTQTEQVLDRSMNIGRIIFHTAHQTEYGHFTLAIVTGASHRLNTHAHYLLTVVKVTYNESRDAYMDLIFESPVPPDIVGLFINKDVVGVISDKPELSILAINLSDRRSTFINTDVPTNMNSSLPGSTISANPHDDDIFVTYESGCRMHVHRFPSRVIPYSGTQAHRLLPFREVGETQLTGAETFVLATRVPSCIGEEAKYQYTLVPGNPTYGIHAVSAHYRQLAPFGQPSTSLRFWSLPTKTPAAGSWADQYLTEDTVRNLPPSPDIFTDPCPTLVSMPGYLLYGFSNKCTTRETDILWVSYSGTYVLLATTAGRQLHMNNTQTSFQLIHYENTDNGGKCSVHLLSFPHPASDIMSVALEEHCGILLVTTVEGILYSVPYA